MNSKNISYSYKFPVKIQTIYESNSINMIYLSKIIIQNFVLNIKIAAELRYESNAFKFYNLEQLNQIRF